MTNIDLAYYPGCPLSSTAREIDEALNQVCHRLDIDLKPLPDWNCCGSFRSVARPDIVAPMVTDIMDKTIAAGAECVVTACAMCQLNLELTSPAEKRLPVFSVVERLAYGMGSMDWSHWFKKHLIDPLPLFKSKGFAI
jgi:heterodisulfide reductase subunit B